jgi:hypothetical protein
MAGYSVERSILVTAPPHQVHVLVDDFHHWTQWSPWEDLDPDLERSYTGVDQGLGAHYAWSGNRKAGRGSMEITGSTPEGIDVAVTFLKPFPSTSTSHFAFVPHGSGTQVTWRMTGEQKGLMGAFSKIVSMDRLIGPDFERGLSRLKSVAEA